jgi:uncharacterized protein
MEHQILIVFLAFIMEVIDSGLGMGFGTVLSPLLIIFGFSPKIVVPAILFSQAIGGLIASVAHNKHKNADLFPSYVQNEHDSNKHLYLSKDLRITLLVGVLGVTASVVGALLGVKISKELMKLYIGILVTIIGIALLVKRYYNFSWKKITAIAFISAFNKGLSGGGFGPLMTGGQVLSGNQAKRSIGSTTLSEVPICIAGFLTYFLAKKILSYDLLILLSIGAFFGGIVGPFFTKYINTKILQTIIAILILSEGIWLLCQFMFHLSFGG